MRCDVFFFKQKTAYEMRISDGSSDACSSDLLTGGLAAITALASHPSAPGLVAVGHTSFTRPDTITAWRPDGSSTPPTALPGPAIEPTAVSQVRSEENTAELQSLMRNSYAALCLKKKKDQNAHTPTPHLI